MAATSTTRRSRSVKLLLGRIAKDCEHIGAAKAIAYVAYPVSIDLTQSFGDGGFLKEKIREMLDQERAHHYNQLEFVPNSMHECHHGIGQTWWVAYLREPQTPEAEEEPEEINLP